MRYGAKTFATALVAGVILACVACSPVEVEPSVLAVMAGAIANPTPTVPMDTNETDRLLWSAYGISASVTGLQSSDTELMLTLAIVNSRSETVQMTASFVTVNGIVVDRIEASGSASPGRQGRGSIRIGTANLKYAGIEQIMDICFIMTLSWDDGANVVNVKSSTIDVRTDVYGHFKQSIAPSLNGIMLDKPGLIIAAIAFDPTYTQGSPAIIVSIDHRGNGDSIILGTDDGSGATKINGGWGRTVVRAELPGNSFAVVGIRVDGFPPGHPLEPSTISLILTVEQVDTGDVASYPVTIKFPL